MRVLSVLLLLVCFVVAGCTDTSNDSSDNHNRFGGFYAGGNVGGGVAR